MKFEVVCRVIDKNGEAKIVRENTNAIDEGSAGMKIEKKLSKKYASVDVRGISLIY